MKMAFIKYLTHKVVFNLDSKGQTDNTDNIIQKIDRNPNKNERNTSITFVVLK